MNAGSGTHVAMTGGGGYSLATKGAKDVIDGAWPLVETAIARIPDRPGRAFTLSDMGTARRRHVVRHDRESHRRDSRPVSRTGRADRLHRSAAQRLQRRLSAGARAGRRAELPGSPRERAGAGLGDVVPPAYPAGRTPDRGSRRRPCTGCRASPATSRTTSTWSGRRGRPSRRFAPRGPPTGRPSCGEPRHGTRAGRPAGAGHLRNRRGGPAISAPPAASTCSTPSP